MNKKSIFTITLLSTLIAITGCRRNPGANFADNLNYDESDIAMAARFQSGTLITDVVFNDVKFPYDSFIIPSSEIAHVEAVINYLKENRGTVVICEGHCDERGTREYNLVLGENRAQAVRAYMVNSGINSNRIQTRSMGEDVPLNPAHNSSAWAENRRVEFELYK